jgi:hypothetical protein
MPDQPSLELMLLRDQLEHYRLQRHDFLNHWQVIMGYLQLGKTESALNYMKKGLNGLMAEQNIGQIPQEAVAAVFLSFVIELRKEAVEVTVELDHWVKDANFWEEFWQEEYAQALYGYTKDSLNYLMARKPGLKEPQLVIRLNRDKPLVCELTLRDGEPEIWVDSFSLYT